MKLEIKSDQTVPTDCCSQMIMRRAMNLLKFQDASLLRSMRGLAGGMGVRHACGIVTGAACAFALADETMGPKVLFPRFYEWFYTAYGEQKCGINCIELLDGDFENHSRVCPEMILESCKKVQELLSMHGFGA